MHLLKSIEVGQMTKMAETIEKLVKDGLLREKLSLRPSLDRVTFLLLRITKGRAVLQTEGEFILDRIEIGGKERIEFLPTKQKAVERRTHMGYLRSTGYNECVIPNQLCMKCINCGLFGAVQAERGREGRFNLKSRILYSSAYSLQDADKITETKTQTAVDEVTQSTEQALFEIEYVIPGAIFPSIVVIRDPTYYDFLTYLKTLSQPTRYGARTSLGGEIENTIVGIIFSKEFITTPLDFLLDLEQKLVGDYAFEKVLKSADEYLHAGINKGDKVFAGKELKDLLNEVKAIEITKDTVDKWNQDVASTISDELQKLG
jgi:CRISPR type I-D-associated protein Csc2